MFIMFLKTVQTSSMGVVSYSPFPSAWGGGQTSTGVGGIAPFGTAPGRGQPAEYPAGQGPREGEVWKVGCACQQCRSVIL